MTKKLSSVLLSASVLGLALLFSLGIAFGSSEYLDGPGSINATYGTSYSCGICHTTPNPGSSARNPFGTAWASTGAHAIPINTALGNLDTDGDGVSNANELSAGTYPYAPMISITAPTGGTVTGTITVTATASDNTGSSPVAGVQFKLDGINLGAEDTTSPYSVSWNTTTASNGTHTLTAVARSAGNTAISAARIVTISNASDTTAPSVTVFTVPTSSSFLTVSGISITATDAVGVTGYIITESSTAPLPSAAGWVSVTSTTSFSTTAASYTVASTGLKTLYVYAKDVAGNVSTSLNDSVTITPVSDFDGDGKTDCAVYRASNGDWYIVPSGGGPAYSIHWGGNATDKPVPGDYDGDGQTDKAVWRAVDGYWYIVRSSDAGVTQTQWGLGSLNDVPVPGDFDGDGKTDIAVWRPGNGVWYIIRSSDGGVIQTQWGTLNDIPVPGDYDGDGNMDIAVWRPGDGVWYIKRSSDSGVTQTQWGTGTLFAEPDKPVPGDYDGDGKTDIAVWRPGDGYWFILRSSDSGVTQTQWGTGTLFTEPDKPVPGDFDGDGKTDIAVWRPGNGIWYIDPSGVGSTYGLQWGGDATDIPVSMPIGSMN